MAISVAVAVDEETADTLIAHLKPRIENLKVGAYTDPEAEMGPLVTEAPLDKVKGYVDVGVEEGAELVVDGRDHKPRGHENGFFDGRVLV